MLNSSDVYRVVYEVTGLYKTMIDPHHSSLLYVADLLLIQICA